MKRIVFASSNHAFGMYSVDDKLSIDAPFRPDGFYGLSKAWGEDMTRMYWDKHGIEGISVRIGSTLERPTEFRHLSTWFGYEDVTQFMMCCIEAREVGYLAVWGVSNNTRSYWDNSVAERIGYRPVQNAEDYAERDPAPAQSARPGRPHIPGRQLHDDGLYPAREAAARFGREGSVTNRVNVERDGYPGPRTSAAHLRIDTAGAVLPAQRRRGVVRAHRPSERRMWAQHPVRAGHHLQDRHL